MQDAYLSPRKRRRSAHDDLGDDDVDRPRHRSDGSALKRGRSFRKRPRAFPMSPVRPGSSDRPPPTSSSPVSSPRAARRDPWVPDLLKEPISDDDLPPIHLPHSTPRKRLARRSSSVRRGCSDSTICSRILSDSTLRYKSWATRTPTTRKMRKMLSTT